MKKVITLMLVLTLALTSVFATSAIAKTKAKKSAKKIKVTKQVKIKKKKPTKLEKLFKKNTLPKTVSEMEKKYLAKITVKVYILEGDKKVSRKVNICVHKKLKSKFKSAISKMYKAKFPIEFNKEKNFYGINTYSWRHSMNSQKMSMHAYGVAIDINPVHNEEHTKYDKLKNSSYKLTKKIIKIWKSYGFKWGGDWSTPDCMHFEFS